MYLRLFLVLGCTNPNLRRPPRWVLTLWFPVTPMTQEVISHCSISPKTYVVISTSLGRSSWLCCPVLPGVPAADSCQSSRAATSVRGPRGPLVLFFYALPARSIVSDTDVPSRWDFLTGALLHWHEYCGPWKTCMLSPPAAGPWPPMHLKEALQEGHPEM